MLPATSCELHIHCVKLVGCFQSELCFAYTFTLLLISALLACPCPAMCYIMYQDSVMGQAFQQNHDLHALQDCAKALSEH